MKLVVSISSIYKFFKQKYTTKEDLEEFEKLDDVGKWLKFCSAIIELETSFK